MSNSFFRFKQFIIHQDKCAMKVTTDACLFGAWVAENIRTAESKAINGLDIGCGTGLLSLMIAQKCDIDLDAVEIDEETSLQAIENEEACSFKNAINIINADIRNYHAEKKYDVIISNPPFYENELKSDSVTKNTAHHSSNLSLEELLTAIKKNLSDEGIFFLLLPFKRESEVRTLVRESGMKITMITLVRQSVNHDYFRIMIMGKKSSEETAEIVFEEISICDERRQYTEEFVELLEDYYLYL
jgi:tRNA1Val (adenine37-N6)-methyltransferase